MKREKRKEKEKGSRKLQGEKGKDKRRKLKETSFYFNFGCSEV